MKSHLMSIALAVLVLAAASSGCAHRTTIMHHTDIVTTDSTRKAPQPVVDVTTDVTKHSHSSTEGKQQ